MKLTTRLKQIFSSPFDHDVARALYVTIVSQAREPAFYEVLSVPDTPEGRYDMVALHTYMVLKRLQSDATIDTELSQALFDIMFADMDQNLRELSIGDTGVAKRIKKMAEGFYGRAAAYDTALDANDGDIMLKDAINRNIFRNVQSTEQGLVGMAQYLRQELTGLQDQGREAIVGGTIEFGPLRIE
jgi:cytochrome b pre-mRNA-processing protein 3